MDTDSGNSLWQACLTRLEGELSAQQFNTWIRPLHVEQIGDKITLLAPNRFVLDWVNNRFRQRIGELLLECGNQPDLAVHLALGEPENGTATTPAASDVTTISARTVDKPAKSTDQRPTVSLGNISKRLRRNEDSPSLFDSSLNLEATFDTFVEGKSNQLARAAATQVAQNPGNSYNPLFIYGGVGLGKTHLMYAIGNAVKARVPDARIAYLHSEKFVQDMVRALQHNAISRFKKHYRSLDVLLIDDIQFFAGKERSQEEFFHTFNALLEGQQQVVLTSDRYPKEVKGLEERLKSRFGWGLTVAIEPPELETRVAILMTKAQQQGAEIPRDVAFFIAKRIRSNIRELEGALRRVIANSRFTRRAINMDHTREWLKDLLALQDKMVTVENIQKTVAEYYKIRLSDLMSKKRTRSLARPRQLAMMLSKELTSHSLPEIGQAFGGRDHTTVIHACRKITELRGSDSRMKEDYSNLLRTLTT